MTGQGKIKTQLIPDLAGSCHDKQSWEAHIDEFIRSN